MSVELSDSVINGRFKYLDKPNVLPGNCAVCGSVERPVIDFDASVDGYGAILICGECINAAASLVSLVEGANQVVPLPNLVNLEALNEYVESALAATNRLHVILDFLNLPGIIPKDDSDEAIRGERENEELPEPTESESTVDSVQDSYSAFDEGPISIPASGSDEPRFTGFEL